MSLEARREDLWSIMERRGLGAVVMRRPAHFAWYTGGGGHPVGHPHPFGVPGVLLPPAAPYGSTGHNQAPTMRGEQTPRMDIAEHPWHTGPGALLKELAGGTVGTDHPSGLGPDVSDEVSPLRRVLDDEAIGRYRLLGADATAAISEAASSLSPDTDELEAAAGLAAACRRRGMFAPVLLAASADRLGRYRHPIPSGGPLGARAMLVVCAERGGLYANLTRMVIFGDPDPETIERQEACEEILARMRLEATVPGTTLADAFDLCRKFYAERGFPDGWRDHHQGGTTGYASREVVASPETRQEILAGQAFAWNPSLPGAKAEETFVLLPGGPEVLTPA